MHVKEQMSMNTKMSLNTEINKITNSRNKESSMDVDSQVRPM